MYNTQQERFWAETYAEDYVKRNSIFDQSSGEEAWRRMLNKTKEIDNILECGCNIGRNLNFLSKVLPDSAQSIIELSKPAYDYVLANRLIKNSFNGAIVESNFTEGSFDLVFTIGVLIHIHPDNLISNMRKMFDYSRKYILIGEYFNRTPTMIEYRGEQNQLFKRDFGKLFIENFNVSLVDYGFLWGHLYDKAGFDDITWWLFERK